VWVFQEGMPHCLWRLNILVDLMAIGSLILVFTPFGQGFVKGLHLRKADGFLRGLVHH
jgi:hypothetical protein